MTGGQRAGYMQIAGSVDAIYINAAAGACTGNWTDISLVTDKVNFASITAPGMVNSSLISSGTTYTGYGSKWQCSQFTAITVTAGAVIAHNKVLY